MAINDRYKEFSLHQDNVQEIISADDINAIQTEVQESEQYAFEARDNEFLNKCLFVLENHPVVNAMWIDNLQATNNLNMGSFAGMNYVPQESALSLIDGTTSATVTTLTYSPATGSSIQKVVLMVDDYQPAGSSVVYYISNDGGKSWTPIAPNQSLPLALSATDNQLQIRAQLQRTGVDKESPVIYAWAVLYEDLLYTPYIPDSMPGSTPFTTQISHATLIEVLPDQHHPQVHTHDGIDGSGQVYHRSLLEIGEDDHHPKSISTAGFLVKMIESISGVKSRIRSRFGISRLCCLLVCRVQLPFTGIAAQIASFAFPALMLTPISCTTIQDSSLA